MGVNPLGQIKPTSLIIIPYVKKGADAMKFEGEVFAKELETLYVSLPVPLLASLFNALFLAAVLYGHINPSVLIIWMMLTVILTLFRYASYHYYRRTSHIQSLKKLYFIYLIGMMSSSLLWGVSSIFLFPESLVYALIVVFMAGGMAAGALGSISYRFEAYVMYNLGILAPFILTLFLHSLREFTIMGIILILFSTMLILASKKFYRNFHNAITLGFEQKQLLHNLAQALEETRQASLVKETFFATMSHELRTPLNSIIGFSQILSQKKEIPAGLITYINKILLSGNHLLELVNSILDFSKLKAGKMEPYKTRFLLRECFSEIEMIIEPLAQNRSIQIIYPNFDKAEIIVDRKMIQQVFLNLLSNAIKFSPVNERINITYQFLTDEHLFSICDHGHGIASDHLETIFTPFSQLEEHKAGTPKGTGLGLAIVKEMIEMHKGKVWVESVIGEGSCFYISLPTTNN